MKAQKVPKAIRKMEIKVSWTFKRNIQVLIQGKGGMINLAVFGKGRMLF